MRDLFGNEVTMEQALALKRRKPAADRASLVALRIERGVHPHNGMPLRQPPGETCGSCKHHYAKRYSKTFHKCDFTNDTGGPATDIRVRWPACSKWEAKEGTPE